MSYGTLTVFLVICTVALYFWFFRANDEDYTEQKYSILEDTPTKDDATKKNSEEGKHE